MSGFKGRGGTLPVCNCKMVLMNSNKEKVSSFRRIDSSHRVRE